MARGKSGDSNYSMAELETMMSAQRGRLGKLQAREHKLAADLDAVRAEIESISGGSAGAAGDKPAKGGRRKSRGPRARNASPLPDVIEQVMGKGSGPMRVPEIADAVLATGYNTNSANFKGIVNQTLIKEDRFKQVERGLYGLAKGGENGDA